MAMRKKKKVEQVESDGILTAIAAVVRGERTRRNTILYSMQLGLWEQQKKGQEDMALDGKANYHLC